MHISQHILMMSRHIINPNHNYPWRREANEPRLLRSLERLTSQKWEHWYPMLEDRRAYGLSHQWVLHCFWLLDVLALSSCHERSSLSTKALHLYSSNVLRKKCFAHWNNTGSGWPPVFISGLGKSAFHGEASTKRRNQISRDTIQIQRNAIELYGTR